MKILEHYFTSNENLKSELRTIKYGYLTQEFNFTSDNGVFSKNEIDFGSELLVKSIIKNVNNKNLNILDVGCGYGYIGITLSKVMNSHVDLIDVNKRAIHLALMNIKNNKVDAKAFLSNIYENITNKYDLIVTNPPIRAGKEVVYEILREASSHLNKDGELWFVIRKDQGAKSAYKDMSSLYQLEIIEKSKGFYIFKAKKNA